MKNITHSLFLLVVFLFGAAAEAKTATHKVVTFIRPDKYQYLTAQINFSNLSGEASNPGFPSKVDRQQKYLVLKPGKTRIGIALRKDTTPAYICKAYFIAKPSMFRSTCSKKKVLHASINFDFALDNGLFPLGMVFSSNKPAMCEKDLHSPGVPCFAVIAVLGIGFSSMDTSSYTLLQNNAPLKEVLLSISGE